MPPVEEFETTCPNCKKDFDVRSDDEEVACPHCSARVRLVESAPAPPAAPAPAPYLPPPPRKPTPLPHAPDLRVQAPPPAPKAPPAPAAAKPAPVAPYVPPAPPKAVVKAPAPSASKRLELPPPTPEPIVAPAAASKPPRPSLRQLLRIAEPDESLLKAKAKALKQTPAKPAKTAKPVKEAKAPKPAKAPQSAPDERAAPPADRAGMGFARLNFLTRRERTPLDSDEAVPILEIEGIGPSSAQKLGKAGIVSSDDLLGRDLKAVAKKTGLETRDLQKWQDMADLIHVKGIGPQFAEVLVRCDINSVAELARQEPKPLASKVQAFLDSKQVTIVGAGISTGRTKAWIKEAKRLAPPPADVGKQALQAVRGKPEPQEDVPAKKGQKLDSKQLAEDAKKDAERGFLTRFARRNVANVPDARKTKDTDRTTIGDDIPVARKSLFRRDPEAAARRAELREAAKSQNQKDAEAKAKAKAAAETAKAQAKRADAATKEKEREAAAQAKALAASQAAARKAEERRLAEERKAKDVAARTAAKSAATTGAPLAADTSRKGLPFLSRSPLETVDCAHCGHKFSVKASQRKATCPSCHSVLALVGDGEPLPAVAVKPAAGKPAPTPKPVIAAPAPVAPPPAKAAKPAKAGKAASATGAAMLAASQAEPADEGKKQSLLAKQAALEGSRSKDEAAKNAKAQQRAAAGEEKAKAKLAKAEAKAKAKEAKRAAKLAKKEEKLKLKQAKAAAKATPESGQLESPAKLGKADRGAPTAALAAPPTKGGKKAEKALANAKAVAPKAAAGAKLAESAGSGAQPVPSDDKKALKLAAKEAKAKAKADAKAAKLAAKQQKAADKAAAKAAKLAAKGKTEEAAKLEKKADAKAAKILAKPAKAAPAEENLSPRQLAKLEKQKAKDEERRKREMERREADKQRLAGIENAGLWAQATARPIPKSEQHGTWEASVEDRREVAKSGETKAERKAALKGKVRLVDGRSLFAKLPEDTPERKPPRLPDGESPFKHLKEDDKVEQAAPRLADGRSAFERLPEDDPIDFDRIQVFGHKAGREYTTRGGFHITEEVIATETAPEVELGTKKDRASRRASKDEEKRRRKEDKEQKKAAAIAAKEEGRKLREERAAKAGTAPATPTTPVPAAKGQPAAKELAGKPVDAKADQLAASTPKLSFKERLAALKAGKGDKPAAETKAEAKTARDARKDVANAELNVKKPTKAVGLQPQQTKQSFAQRIQALKEQRAKAAAEKAKEKEVAAKAKEEAARAKADAKLAAKQKEVGKPATAGKKGDGAAQAEPSVPLAQRFRGFLPTKTDKDETPTKAEAPVKAAKGKADKSVKGKAAKSVKGEAKPEGLSFAQRFKQIQDERAKAAAEKAKRKEVQDAEKAKLKAEAAAQKAAERDTAETEPTQKGAKAKATKAAKGAKAKPSIFGAIWKDDKAKAQAAKDRKAAKAAKLEAKAEAQRRKEEAKEAKLAAKSVGADAPKAKAPLDDGERDRRIRAASKEQARLDRERARSDRQAAKAAAKDKARAEKQALALAKAEAKAAANAKADTQAGEALASFESIPAPAPSEAKAAKARAPTATAWEPPTASAKAGKAKGRRGPAPADALRSLLPSAGEAPSKAWAPSRPEPARAAPPSAVRSNGELPATRPAKPTVERVAVERVIEKTVVRPLAYDQAKIDAALRKHGQQPPR